MDRLIDRWIDEWVVEWTGRWMRTDRWIIGLWITDRWMHMDE